MDWVWPELVWFALGCGAMWGFLRILPGRLYRGEFNDLSPVAYYKVPSTVDSPEAIEAHDYGAGIEAHGDEGATEGPNTEPAHEAHMGEGYMPPHATEDERRAALIEAIRAREAGEG